MYSATDPAQVRMEHLTQDRREANVHDLAKALATAHDELAAAYAGAHADFNRAVEEIERLREQLDRCNAERQRLAEELSEARAETQQIAAELATERTEHQRTIEGSDRMAAEIERLRTKLDQPCGSCHPCTNYADETWRAAGRRPPHVSEWDELRAEVERLRAELAAEQMVSASMRAALEEKDAER